MNHTLLEPFKSAYRRGMSQFMPQISEVEMFQFYVDTLHKNLSWKIVRETNSQSGREGA